MRSLRHNVNIGRIAVLVGCLVLAPSIVWSADQGDGTPGESESAVATAVAYPELRPPRQERYRRDGGRWAYGWYWRDADSSLTGGQRWRQRPATNVQRPTGYVAPYARPHDRARSDGWETRYPPTTPYAQRRTARPAEVEPSDPGARPSSRRSVDEAAPAYGNRRWRADGDFVRRGPWWTAPVERDYSGPWPGAWRDQRVGTAWRP